MALNAEQAAKRVDALYAKLSNRRGDVDKRERYFRGKHRLTFMSDEFKKFHEDRYRDFSDNWCETVARASAELRKVTGFRIGNDTQVLSSDERALLFDWHANDGPAQSAQGFLSGAVTSRSYAMVWGTSDDEPELTWEHANQVVEGSWTDSLGRKVTDHLKVWREDDTEFATLYEPDEVWKYERPATTSAFNAGHTESGLIVPVGFGDGGWSPRRGAEPNPVPNPLGVSPLVEYPNRPLLGHGPISDIDGAIAMQDAVNLMWAYLFNSADYASMPGRVVTGAEPPKMPILDENGNVVGEKPLDIEALAKGRMLWLTGQGAKIEQWDAAKLDVFTSTINVMVKHLASQTRTPIHYIMGDLGNVNGETLLATDSPRAMKINEANLANDRAVRETFRRMALVRGNDAVAEACRTAEVQWLDPERSTQAQVGDAALKARQIGWPFEAILERIYGLTQEEIDRVLAQREAEAMDPIARALVNDVTAQNAQGGQ